MTDSMTDKIAIRQHVRQKRSALPAYRQHLASYALARRILLNVPAIHHVNRIAFYLAQNGEIDLLPLMLHCFRQGRQCYLPVLGRPDNKILNFAEWKPGQPMIQNRYGIPEPAVHDYHLVSATDIELIFMPLVAFDDYGNRLGMGGGYYDHTLAKCCAAGINRPGRNRHTNKCPFLVATGHDIQHVPKLSHEAWDIIPDMTITPARTIRPSDYKETA